MARKIILLLVLASVIFSCKKETETNPMIETTTVKSVASYTCYAKATVLEKGSYGLVDYGFVYSTYNGDFGVENSNTKVSLGTIPMVADTFSTSFPVGTGYSYSNLFYVRAYYTNKKGTVYGSILNFQPLQLSINLVQPNSGKAGDKITITGNNFSKNTEDNIVKFNDVVAQVLEASPTKLVVEVPAGLSSNSYDSGIPIYVTVGGLTLSWSSFALQPVITGFSPSSGTFETAVTITGSNLYQVQIKINNTVYYTNYNNNNSFQFNIPYDIKTSKISFSVVKNGTETAVPGEFTMDPCSITSVEPKKGLIGSQTVISGIGFNPDYYVNTIKIGGVKVINYWNGGINTLYATVPESLKSGTYDVSVNNGIEDAVLPQAFTVMEPKITGFSPASASYNSVVKILGENLIDVQYVGFGYTGAEIISRDSSNIVVRVPSNISTGSVNVSANVGNITIYSPKDFTILSPVITSFSPSEGTPGTIVTIKGNGFDSGKYNTSVKFGTITSTVLSVNPTEIKTVVPSEAEAGAMKLLVITPWYAAVSDTDFTVKK